MEYLIGIVLRDAGFALSTTGMVLLACGFAGFVFTLVHMRPRRSPRLRRCPVCAADAVAAVDHDAVDGAGVVVVQECGQCGTWRREVSTQSVIGRHERRLEQDRADMLRCAERLERDRTGLDLVALRDEIVGAEDLLARIPPATAPHRGLDL